MSDKWEEVLDERDALEASLATARRELDEARAERDRAADYLRQIAASDSDATGMRALARAGLASLLSAKPSPESSPEAKP